MKEAAEGTKNSGHSFLNIGMFKNDEYRIDVIHHAMDRPCLVPVKEHRLNPFIAFSNSQLWDGPLLIIQIHHLFSTECLISFHPSPCLR